jgi:HlyD family secretion protein
MDTDLQKLRIEKSQKARRDTANPWPWILLILLLAGGAVAFYFYRQSRTAVEVQVQRVHASQGSARNDDLVLLNATGYIMAAHRIELASKVIGRVAWVGVEMGDTVKKDQELVRLEQDEFLSRVDQARAQLNNAQARLAELKAGSRPQEIAQMAAQLNGAQIDADNARRNYERLKNLKDSTLYTEQELDNAKSAWDTKAAQVENMHQQLELMKAGTRDEQITAQDATVKQLEAVLAMAQLDLKNTVIRAPMDSTILERNVEVGEFVTTGFVGDRGAKGFVVSIADLNDLLVDLDISQNDFAKVSDDQPCWVTTDAYPDRKYNGKVELISPVANRQKATIEVRVKITTPDRFLKPDMNATVAFLSPAKLASTQTGATRPDAERPTIRIPAAAVLEGHVWIVENGHAEKRPVKTGLSSTNGDVEITSGLIGGEDLILNPPASLKEGDNVSVK